MGSVCPVSECTQNPRLQLRHIRTFGSPSFTRYSNAELPGSIDPVLPQYGHRATGYSLSLTDSWLSTTVSWLSTPNPRSQDASMRAQSSGSRSLTRFGKPTVIPEPQVLHFRTGFPCQVPRT